jgi:putative membrane protein insertion efficiency factor
MVKHVLTFLWHLPRLAAIALLNGYQQTLSPDHGPLKGLYPYGYCRHEPTCSEYGKQVMEQKGFVVGFLLLTKRVLSCHPWKRLDERKVQKILEKL